ncbi:MAG: hypothetical protein WBY22_04855 [Nitrososphaeraceae archaeon]
MLLLRRPIDHVKRRHRTLMFDFYLPPTAPNYIKGDYCTICEKKFTGTALSHARSKHEERAAKEFVNAGLHQ